MKKLAAIVSSLVFLFWFNSMSHAVNIPIDLNQFYADPSVIIAPDGSSAIMNEDGVNQLMTVLLSNDPSLGDPGILYTDDLLNLTFNYNFLEGPINADDFYVKLFDGNTGAILHEFLIEDTSSGAISWSLLMHDPSISLLGLEFQLNSYDSLYDSSVYISGVSMETSSAPVPEPSTMILLGTGILSILGLKGRKFYLSLNK